MEKQSFTDQINHSWKNTEYKVTLTGMEILLVAQQLIWVIQE